MSLKDDVNEISENNVTIAENQEAVYNAGVRAGLLQDPDYSEGYEDGYDQGLSDASGVVWGDLLSGKTPVGRAKEADHASTADSANHASTADSANHASTADSAINAGHASTADSAINAGHASTADSATTAGHASTAGSAGHASTADSATTAGHATSATTANSANDLGKVLDIKKGGTGGNTPAAALNNLGAASIVTGSYVGTGTCGASNPNVLTFDRPVKKLEILPGRESEDANVTYYPASSHSDDYEQYYGSKVPLVLYGVHYRATERSSLIYVTSFGKTVSWYAPDTIQGEPIDRSDEQRNEAGKIYEYIAYM